MHAIRLLQPVGDLISFLLDILANPLAIFANNVFSYANHEQSAKLDKDISLKAEKKMTKLQADSGLSWIEVQFLQSASQCLQDCRQTLKWTYAFAYYLARNNQTEMFEDNQKDLELAVENLSEMFEKSTDQLSHLKVEMMDKVNIPPCNGPSDQADPHRSHTVSNVVTYCCLQPQTNCVKVRICCLRAVVADLKI